MNLGPHAAFIIAVYAAAIVVIGALIAWVALDYRGQKRLLGDLDAQGVGQPVAVYGLDAGRDRRGGRHHGRQPYNPRRKRSVSASTERDSRCPT